MGILQAHLERAQAWFWTDGSRGFLSKASHMSFMVSQCIIKVKVTLYHILLSVHSIMSKKDIS